MFKIREGVKEDCPAIYSMFKELAEYNREHQGRAQENMLHEPVLNVQMLEKEAFGKQRHLQTIVVELEESKQLIGYSYYYFKYSGKGGKTLYLEDIYIKSEYRHLGVGRALLTEVTKHAYNSSCNDIEWSAWDWNHNSIKFYEKFGANKLYEIKGILSFGLNKQQINSIAKESDNKIAEN